MLHSRGMWLWTKKGQTWYEESRRSIFESFRQADFISLFIELLVYYLFIFETGLLCVDLESVLELTL